MGAASPPATQHNEILITDNRVTTRSYSFSANAEKTVEINCTPPPAGLALVRAPVGLAIG